MGAFASAAGRYLEFRQPYPESFFREAAERLGLDGSERLIDLGTGPGPLALGFARFVGTVTGVDPEPAMLAEAAREAEARKIELRLIASRVEDLPADLGAFDLVTIGRALHWMDRDATLPVLDRLAPRGRILICSSRTKPGEDNPWLGTFDRIRRSWAKIEEERYRIDPDAWFFASGFTRADRIVVETRSPITIEHLAERAFTMSSTSPEALGERIGACRAEMAEALAPFFHGGAVTESIETTATVMVRAAAGDG